MGWPARCRVAWWSGLVGSATGTFLLGGARLPSPPLSSPSLWSGWWERLGPVVATFSLLRIGVAALAAYLVLVGCVATAVYRLRRPRLWRVLRWMAPPSARRLVLASLGIAGTVSVLAASGGVAMASPHAGRGGAVVAGDSTPVLRLVQPSPPVLRSSNPGPRQAQDPTPNPAQKTAPKTAPTPAPSDMPSGRQPDHWVVEPGDSLWSIAAATVKARSHTDDHRAIAHYWWRVVQANRPYLPNPSDPDLIFPGDVVTLPTLG